MLDTFWVISALASSTSSRTSVVTRSETSTTVVARFSGCPFLPGKALEDHRKDKAAGERGADRDLGSFGLHLGRRVTGAQLRRARAVSPTYSRPVDDDGLRASRRRRLGARRHGLRSSLRRRHAIGRRRLRSFGLIGHSGGSSPNMRRQTRLATRVEAMLASAPEAGEQARPDQPLDQGAFGHRCGIQSDSVWARAVASERVHRFYPSSPRQIVSTINVFACSSSSLLTGSTSKIQPVKTCSTQP